MTFSFTCLFGHHFGKIEGGYQYCKWCGEAKTVHPCSGGHLWADTGDARKETQSCIGERSENIRRSQKCSMCGAYRSVLIF